MRFDDDRIRAKRRAAGEVARLVRQWKVIAGVAHKEV